MNTPRGKFLRLWGSARHVLTDPRSTEWEKPADHVTHIQEQQEKLVVSLANVQEIASMMYHSGKLTTRELNNIQEFRLTPFRACEEILAIIMTKPRDVYDSFLSSLKKTKQYDVYQMLTYCDQPFAIEKHTVPEHSHFIWQNYDPLRLTLNADYGFLWLLLEREVISGREYKRILSEEDRIERNEALLDVICRKSSYDFRKFKDALEETHQEISLEYLADVPHGEHTVSEHSRFIWQNYELIISTLDVDSGLLSLLLERQVISAREYEYIRSKEDRFQRNEALLDVIRHKSSGDFRKFENALEETHQKISVKQSTDVLYGEPTVSEYSRFIWQNYELFTSTLDVDSGFLSLLLERQVISARECERIRSKKDRIQRNETLLSVIRYKSSDDFRKFQDTWEEIFPRSSVRHLTDVLDVPFGSTEWRLAQKTLLLPRNIRPVGRPSVVEAVQPKFLRPRSNSPERLETKSLSSHLHLSALFAKKPLISTPALKRSTAVLKERFKKLPDGLQTDVSAKVILTSQSTRGTSSDSLWDICLQKVILEFQKRNLSKRGIPMADVKYKTILEKNQLHIADLQETINYLKFRNFELRKTLSRTELQFEDLKRETTYKEQLAAEKEYTLTEQLRFAMRRLGLEETGTHEPYYVGPQKKVESKPFISYASKQIRGKATMSKISTAKDKKTVDVSGETMFEGMTAVGEAPKKLQRSFISLSLTKEQRNEILLKMKSFRSPGVSITTCIFEDDYVEFYFVLEGISSIDKSRLINEIVRFLGGDVLFAESIKVTQLKSKPKGERTFSRPGNPIINMNADPQSITTLGAFVSIEGKGDHVLSCGHDKKVGDILSNGNKERIGTTRAVAYCTEHCQSYDAAVASIDKINYAKSVAYNGGQLHLADTPVDPVKGVDVLRFPPQPTGSRATIRHTDYNSFVYDVYGCIAIITDNREDFHKPGESGLIVTSLPSAESSEIVGPIGMLFFREFVEKTDDGRGYYLSLAIPTAKNLEKLQEDEYCRGRQIKFTRDPHCYPLDTVLSSEAREVFESCVSQP